MADHLSAMVITKIFPPEAAVGVHRITGLCRHLVQQGWRVTVITCRPDPASYDQDLMPLIPKGIAIVRTPAPELLAIASGIAKGRWIRSLFKPNSPAKNKSAGNLGAKPSPISISNPTMIKRVINWITWWLQVPDQYIGWLLPAVIAGIIHGFSRRPNVIFSTAPKWTSHLAATTISYMLRVPLVTDFRDPWCGSAFRGLPDGAHRRLDAAMEKIVVNRSVRITCAWDGIRRHLLKRYPNRSNDISTILNGYNPELIEAIAPEFIDVSRCVLLHAGSFYGPRRPEPLLEALCHLKKSIPQISARLVVYLLGPTTYNGQSLERVVENHGLADLVRVHSPVLHHRSIAMTKGADATLLFGQSGIDELASVPAKVFEMAAMHKPTLAIGSGEESCSILRRSGCRLWQCSADNPASIADAIMDIVGCCERRELSPMENDITNSLTTTYMAAQMEEVMRQAISTSRWGRRTSS